MPGISVRVDGDEELGRLLKLTGHRLTEAIVGAVGEASLEVESVAKQLSPVLTGRMRSSIGARIDSDGLGADVIARTEYAEAVEFGTESSPAQPFMTPAVENVRSGYPEIVAKHARRVTGG